jgi:hypothetical protein
MLSILKQIVDRIISDPTLESIEKKVLDKYESMTGSSKPVVVKQAQPTVTETTV